MRFIIPSFCFRTSSWRNEPVCASLLACEALSTRTMIETERAPKQSEPQAPDQFVFSQSRTLEAMRTQGCSLTVIAPPSEIATWAQLLATPENQLFVAAQAQWRSPAVSGCCFQSYCRQRILFSLRASCRWRVQLRSREWRQQSSH